MLLGDPNESKAEKYIKEAEKLSNKSQGNLPTGVWCTVLGKAKRLLDKLKKALGIAAKDEAKAAAEALMKLLKDTVYQQRYKWAPLSKRYLEWKRKKGRDTRILLATHEYVQAIRIIRHEVKSWHDDNVKVFYEVGLPDIVHTDSGLPIRKLAAIHEFGSPKRGIPARPLWRPVAREFARTHKDKILKSLRLNVMKQISQDLREIAKESGR